MRDASCGTARRSSAPPFRVTGATSRISGSGPRCWTAASKTICVTRSNCATYRDVRFDRARAASLAAQAGRGDDFLDKRASELSGGEAQITALIRVLQLAPEVLLLDEPTASLDPESSRAIEALVHAWFAADPGRHASMWVSHDPAQAARMSARHLTMRAGVLDESAVTPAHQELDQ